MAESNASSSFPVFGVLGVVFITLKLCHVIDWSWWWVTAPFWGGFSILFAVLILVGFLKAIEFIVEKAGK